MTTPATKWLNTLSDLQLDNYSQLSLANEAWKRGAAYAAQKILDHIEEIDTIAMATAWRPRFKREEDASAIGSARVQADRFIKGIAREQGRRKCKSQTQEK